jgi:hypothetical protein
MVSCGKAMDNPMHQPLPKDAIDLEREPEAEADHIEVEGLV